MKPYFAVFTAFLGTYVAAAVSFGLVEATFGYRVPAAGLISVIAAAAIAGQACARRTGTVPEGRVASLFAGAFTGGVVVLGAVQALLLPVDLSARGSALMLGYAAVVFLVIRLTFPRFARIALRRPVRG